MGSNMPPPAVHAVHAVQVDLSMSRTGGEWSGAPEHRSQSVPPPRYGEDEGEDEGEGEYYEDVASPTAEEEDGGGHG